MTALTLATARSIADAALEKAAELKLKPLVVTVLDARTLLKMQAQPPRPRYSSLVLQHSKTLLCLEVDEVLEVARVAGIMAAKKTQDLVPLCHSLPLDGVEVEFRPQLPDCLVVEAIARATARTGVEMEALLAVSVSALTVYDMTKAVDKVMVIEEIRLEEKRGGRSGVFLRSEQG